MKFKLDENIGRRGESLLAAAGHDVSTVYGERMSGAGDEALFEVCALEGRVLITLDHDFGQVLRFPPRRAAGTVILELPPRPFADAIERRLKDFLAVHASTPFEGGLWIVGPGRGRIYDGDS